jgi:hypothetical protein
MIKNKIAENATLKSAKSRKIAGKGEIVGWPDSPKVGTGWAGGT